VEHSDSLSDLPTLGPQQALLHPGAELGRYRLKRELGRGGMGVVWLAQDRELGERPVALKFLPEVLIADPVAEAALRREAETMLALTHPGIVRLLTLDSCEGLVFLVMEYLAGPDLKTMLRSRRKEGEPGFTPEEGQWVLARVAPGLDHAHDQGVFHRDLKPANLVLTEQPAGRLGSGSEELRITDFGIAHLARRTVADLTGLPLAGTPAYMAPEAWNATGPTVAMDLFALGATIFELVAGSVPFPDGCRGGKPAPSLRSGNANLDAAVAAMLALDPAKRPPTAGEAARLAVCGKGGPQRAGGRRWWYLAAGAAILAGAVVVQELSPGPSPASPGISVPNNPPGNPPEEKPSPAESGPGESAPLETTKKEPPVPELNPEKPSSTEESESPEKGSPARVPPSPPLKVHVLQWNPTRGLLSGEEVEVRLEVSTPASARVVQPSADSGSDMVLLEQPVDAGEVSLRFSAPPPAGSASKGPVQLRVEIGSPSRAPTWSQVHSLKVVDRDRARIEVREACLGAAKEAKDLAENGRARKAWQRCQDELARLGNWAPLGPQDFNDLDAVAGLRTLGKQIVTKAWEDLRGHTKWNDAKEVRQDLELLGWLKGLVEKDSQKQVEGLARWLNGFLHCGKEIIPFFSRPPDSTQVKRDNSGESVYPAVLVSSYDADVEMVFIPGGTFLMGIAADEMKQYPGVDFDDPGSVRVRLTSFYMSRYELSRKVVETISPGLLPKTKRQPGPQDSFSHTKPEDYPCTGLSWEDATKVAKKFHARLPTEAQWEYAASGNAGKDFVGDYSKVTGLLPFRRTGTDAGDVSWCGIEGLGGNVREWCRDSWLSDRLKRLEPGVLDPIYSGPGIAGHVVRGGDWKMPKPDRHTGARRYASGGSPNIGIRLVLDSLRAD